MQEQDVKLSNPMFVDYSGWDIKGIRLNISNPILLRNGEICFFI